MFETETVGPCLVSEIEVGEGGRSWPLCPPPTSSGYAPKGN